MVHTFRHYNISTFGVQWLRSIRTKQNNTSSPRHDRFRLSIVVYRISQFLQVLIEQIEIYQSDRWLAWQLWLVSMASARRNTAALDTVPNCRQFIFPFRWDVTNNNNNIRQIRFANANTTHDSRILSFSEGTQQRQQHTHSPSSNAICTLSREKWQNDTVCVCVCMCAGLELMGNQ